MTAVLRNRLIGSAILLIAAVVFLPDLLDGQKNIRKDEFKAIPDRPEFAEVANLPVFERSQHDAAKAAASALPVETAVALDDVASSSASLPDQTFASVTAGQPAAAPTVDANLTQPVAAGAPQLSTAPSATDGAAIVNGAAAVSAAKTQSETLPTSEPNPTAVSPTVAAQPAGTAQSLSTGQPAASANVATAKPKAALSQAAWVVKVGSFSKEQNANALVTKLRDAGFATFTRKIISSQGQTMISVLVGPDLQKEKLEKNLLKLEELANIKSLKVTTFSPVENN